MLPPRTFNPSRVLRSLDAGPDRRLSVDAAPAARRRLRARCIRRDDLGNEPHAGIPRSRGPRAMPNRLAGETSPYLIQHADNPVDWHPWGDEALALARREGKPILLSIGYSACHWCHVMAHESFEDPRGRRGDERGLRQHQGRSRGAARPRPDLSDGACADDAALGRLAADDVPDAGGRAVFRRHLFPQRGALRPAGLSRSPAARGRGLPRARRRHRRTGGGAQGRAREPRARSRRTRRACRRPPPQRRSRSSSNGSTPNTAGSARAPKFPHATDLELCLREHRADERRRRARGRPRHARANGRRRHPRSARRRLLSLQRRCRMDDSAFREDALRQRAAARAVRGSRAGDRRCAVRRRRARHRRLDDARDARGRRRVLLEPRCRQRRRGREVLRLDAGRSARAALARGLRGRRAALRTRRPAQFRGPCVESARERSRSPTSRRELRIPLADAAARLAAAKSALFAARESRVRPGLDDKILTSWNALAIAGLARAARALDEPRMGGARARPRPMRCGAPRGATAGCSPRARAIARISTPISTITRSCWPRCSSSCRRDFASRTTPGRARSPTSCWTSSRTAEHGGFFFTSHDHERLFHRTKPGHDNATPSGNGVAAGALIVLGHLARSRATSRQASARCVFSRRRWRAPPRGFLVDAGGARADRCGAADVVLLAETARHAHRWQRALESHASADGARLQRRGRCRCPPSWPKARAPGRPGASRGSAVARSAFRRRRLERGRGEIAA